MGKEITKKEIKQALGLLMLYLGLIPLSVLSLVGLMQCKSFEFTITSIAVLLTLTVTGAYLFFKN